MMPLLANRGTSRACCLMRSARRANCTIAFSTSRTWPARTTRTWLTCASRSCRMADCAARKPTAGTAGRIARCWCSSGILARPRRGV